ncbi:MAG: Mrp/NBP35 family ATP-binding protein [Candidatus Korarchaeota archaeon]|nr:Mrp/NBP35 family ATP-binding protein [Candidatus Korarchaeota archaeon]NIU85356.1 P-loop NTPase [Candidatus Thorarchaeota archaeon]NIW15454.1 P-loop NTPase [Candidatus Thorarchaeota archaeon]NIW53398.1 P-loop NTPase [Candidatus Korarchaeota archaeon]
MEKGKPRSDRLQERRKKINQSLEKVRHKIAVISGKGGVGKSTVATNLATALSIRDYVVGLIDCDLHGPSIPKLLGVRDQRATGSQGRINPLLTDFGLKVISMDPLLPKKDSPVIWRGPLKMKAIQQFIGDVQWGDLDHLIFDLPPGTGDEPLSIAQLVPDPDGAVIVTTPQEVALQTIRRTVEFARKVNLPVLGVVENMSGFICPHCGKKTDIFGSGGGEKLAAEVGIPFLGKIPLSPEIEQSGEVGRPFVLNEDTPATKAFNAIVDKLEEAIQ